MILQKKTINNTPTLVPLTANTREGNPIGTILPLFTNVIPAGYLPCDGSTFDTTTYPALYALLGDNHTPDLREVTLKGTGLTGLSNNHLDADGLAVGEFIDDRVQNHTHDVVLYNATNLVTYNVQSGNDAGGIVTSSSPNNEVNATSIIVGNHGTTTEVKAVGVNFIIKATTGLEESQQDYVLSALSASIQDAIEEVTEETSISGNGSTSGCHYIAYKRNNIVDLYIYTDVTIQNGQDVFFGVLPEGWRPKRNFYFQFAYAGGSLYTTQQCLVFFNANGTLSTYSYDSLPANSTGHCTYFV